MFKLTTLALAVALTSTSAFANSTPIVGNVQSKCTIVTTRTGVYAQPTPDELTTAAADGGRTPIVRVDVSLANYYTAKFVTPNAFSSSPSLTDTVTWTGSVSVSSVSVPAMSGYETAKIEYDNVTEFDLTVAGSVWFEVDSSADYGFNKAFPAGNYTALVTAECIAK